MLKLDFKENFTLLKQFEQKKMKNKEMLVVLLTVFSMTKACYSKKYKPVYLIHGIMTGAESMLLIEEEILRVRK